MTTDRTTKHTTEEVTPEASQREPAAEAHAPSAGGFAARRGAARSHEEAVRRHVAARDAWTAAMKLAASGRPADLAHLAITQEAYEAATAELKRWDSGQRVAIAIEPKAEPPARVDAIVGQELAWRDVRKHEAKPRGLIDRLLGRNKPK